MIARRTKNLCQSFALVIIIVLAIVAPHNCFGQEKTTSEPTWSFVFRVVDDDGTRIKDATIKTRVNKKSNSHVQLPNGDYRITFDSAPKYLRLRCKSEGKTPINAVWGENDLPESSTDPFVVTLPTPKATGGRILDQEGNPIEGATVYLLAANGGERLRPAIYDFPCKTDADGKWTCGVTPPDVQNLWIRLEHPDYISDQTYGETVRNASIEDLHTFSHVAIMRKGTTVSGTVTGPDGASVPNAAVFQGSDRHGTHYPETKTDEAGNFEFKNCADGQIVLTFVAENLAPQLIEIDVDHDSPEPVAVKLSLGKTLTIKVVDPEGNPIPKAWIPIDTWREHRSLADAELPSRTDKNGVFVWKNAPEDEVQCEILVKGYLDHRNEKFIARDEPYVIKKIRPLIVSGTVVDASDGKPIEEFTIIPVGHFTSVGNPNRREAVEGRNGKYEFKFTNPRAGHAVLIEAVGCKPQQSTVFKPDEGNVTFDFKLEKDSGISATVLSEDGEPVEGAVVALADGKGTPLRIDSGRIGNLNDLASTKTGSDGSFSMVPAIGKWTLVVCHDLGFATVNAEKFRPGQKLKLMPWAIIAGRDLKSAGSKIPLKLRLSAAGTNAYAITQSATTDPNGDFEFVKVAPGFVYSLESVVQVSRRFSKHEPIGQISAQAGSRHQITLGQRGRRVFGKLDFEGQRLESAGFAQAKLQRPKTPEGFGDWDEARRQEWKTKWNASEEGMRYQTGRSLEYALLFTGQRNFEIESLPPGFYEISFLLGTDQGNIFQRKRKLHVKAIAADEKDPSPQDFGVIEFKHLSPED